ncbi:MAG: hypothetical protein R2810_03585 [Flavobacteriales bacterium]
MSGTVVFHFDDDQSWNSSTFGTGHDLDNTATWNFTDTELGEQRPGCPSRCTDASVIHRHGDRPRCRCRAGEHGQTPADNVAFLSGEVVGAFDEDDISVLPSGIDFPRKWLPGSS